MTKTTILSAVAVMLLLSGCSKMKDDIDTLKESIPTGLVILNPEYIVQNGKTFEIPFRVNPSNYVVTKENLALDVPASEITRSAYGTSIPEYELTDVQPNKDEKGAVVEGEWVATVAVKDGAYYSESLIALVIKYTDANGRQVQLTSTYLGDINTTVKLTPEMVNLRVFSACSYAKLDGSSYLYTPVDLMPRPISTGSETLFDMGTVQVDSCKVAGENAGRFWVSTTDQEKRSWRLEPNYFFQFPDNARSVPVEVKMWLTDRVSGDQISISKPVAFFRTAYTAPVIQFKLSDWPADGSIYSKDIPVGDAFAQVGVTSELFVHYKSDPIPGGMFHSGKVTDEKGQPTDNPAIIRLNNPHENEPEMKEVTTPEENYLRFYFYAGKLTAGEKYIYKLTVTYSVPGADQPTINAVIDFPFEIVP